MRSKNYVIKASSSSNYWFGLSEKTVEDYKQNFSEFFIIIYGSEEDLMDYYMIPFSQIKDILIPQNLYLTKKRRRWVGDIRSNYLRIRNSNISRNIGQYYSSPWEVVQSSVSLDVAKLNDYSVENLRREINVRIKQSVFRSKVLKNFENKCCLTDINENDVLVASHIIPWASKIETRLDQSNGLCLSLLYDRLFEKGYFTLDNNLQVIITSKVHFLSVSLQWSLQQIQGKKINCQKTEKISIEALQYHRDKIFDKFNL